MDENKVILVVEDEIPLAEAVRLKMEKEGIEVVTARSAEQAIDYLKELNRIDLIWLDHYLLGQRSGFDVLLEIKSDDSKWKKLPVYLISNTATESKIQKYLELGVDKYFVKSSVSLQQIIDNIKNSIIKN